MNEALITWHNEIVKPEDHVSFLGDLTILRGGPHSKQKEITWNLVKKFNGHKRLYLGNHDHFHVRDYLDMGFEKVYATWRTDEGFICSHIPVHPRSLDRMTANVHGHIHNTPKNYEPVIMTGKEIKHNPQPARVVPYINVSVEVVNYRPVHLDTIFEIIKKHNT